MKNLIRLSVLVLFCSLTACQEDIPETNTTPSHHDQHHDPHDVDETGDPGAAGGPN